MIKVGKLSKSISEELDSSSEIHDFRLVITCANSNSATQLGNVKINYINYRPRI